MVVKLIIPFDYKQNILYLYKEAETTPRSYHCSENWISISVPHKHCDRFPLPSISLSFDHQVEEQMSFMMMI